MTKPAMTPERRAFWRGYRVGLKRDRARLRALELSLADGLEELEADHEAVMEKLGGEAACDDAIDAALAAGRDPDDPRG